MQDLLGNMKMYLFEEEEKDAFFDLEI